MAARLFLIFLLTVFGNIVFAQSYRIDVKPRHLKEALQNLDSLDGIPFLNPWDYQMHSEGFGKPGQNALPYVVKQAYRKFRFMAIPEQFNMNGRTRYPPNLPDGKWGVFSENGIDKGAVFEVKNNQLNGRYYAQFSGANLRFFITPFFVASNYLNDFETYSIQGQFNEGKKIGSWKLTSKTGNILLKWSYNSEGKFETNNPLLEKKFVAGLIRYHYVAQDYKKIIQGYAKEVYFTYKVTKDGKLLRNGEYLMFHQNEKIAVKGYYWEGLKDGDWQYWDDSENLIRIDNWEQGKLVSSSSY